MTGPGIRILLSGHMAFFLFATSISAQIIGPDHLNDNYPGPLGEGFLLAGSEPGGTAVGQSAEFPNAAWNVTTAGLQRYKSNTPPITGDFTLTLRGKLTSSQHPVNPGSNPETLRASGLNFVVDAVENANPRYSFGWNEQLTRVIMQHDAQSGLEAQFVALDATQVHTYQLIRQGSVANFLVDGVPQISFVDDFGFDYGQGLDDHTGLFFGSISSDPNSQSDSTWDLIRLEQGANPICVSNCPTTFTWGSSGSGDWSEAGKWTPLNGESPPNNNNETAIFGDSIGNNSRTVFTDSTITVNSIQFQNTMGGAYVVAGAGSVDLASKDDATLPTLGVSNQGNHQFQAIVNLRNDTTATIDGGSTLTFTNSLNLNGNTFTKMGNGTLAINNTISTGGGTLNCAEGMCSGSGTIAGDLNNAGTVSPGNSPGLMTVEGDFAQSSAGTVLIELAGTTAGIEHDVLQVDGEASLGGTLEVSLLDGFSPAIGDVFVILELASISGEFDQVILPALGGNLAWDNSALSQGSISVVPEPSSALLWLLWFFATVGFCQRPSVAVIERTLR